MTDDALRDYLEHGPPPDVDGGVPRIRALLGAASTWDEVPLAGSLDAVLIRLDAERGAGARAAQRGRGRSGGAARHRRTARRRLLAVAAAATLLGAGGGLGWLVAQQTAPAPGPPPTVRRGGVRVPLAGTELAPRARAVARIRNTPSGFAITLDVTGLPPAAPGTFYEAWVRSPSGQLVAVGTFHLRGQESGKRDEEPVELWSGVDTARYPMLTVTLQREGAGGESSGQVVLRGTIPPR